MYGRINRSVAAIRSRLIEFVFTSLLPLYAPVIAKPLAFAAAMQ